MGQCSGMSLEDQRPTGVACRDGSGVRFAYVLRSIVVFVVVLALLLIVLGLFGAVVGPGELLLAFVVALVVALAIRSRSGRPAA